jgi:hypothetical protein
MTDIMDRKSIILAGLAVVFAAACTKSPAEDKTGEEIISGTAIPVSLEVSIGNENPETRLTYELDGAATALKSTWEKDDRISLVTYDQNYKLMGNDVLTAESSGSSVKFTGTYTCPEKVGSSVRTGIVVVYPALSGEPLATPVELSNDYDTSGPYYIGDDGYLYFDSDRKFIQRYDGDLGNLPYYTLMFGTVDRDTFIETGKFSTTLHNLTYVIKAELQLPSTHPDGNYDYNIISVKIRANRSDSPAITPSLIGTGSMDFTRAHFGPNSKIALQTYLGKIRNDGEVMGVSCPRSSKVSVYFIGGFCYSEPVFVSGDKLEITAYYYLDGAEKTLTATKQFNKGIIMNDGFMYTISAALEKVIEY